VNHLGDTNKMVRDTPRTDGEELPHALDDHHFVVGSFFARQLERELNAANDRIKRLEEAGDAVAYNHNPFTFIDWTKAKEDKL
jgi:hypothetical protein